jgi:hypothetical protein
MDLQELFADTEFRARTNIKLALYKLAEDLGIPKEDIVNGVHDVHFNEAMLRIYKQFKKFLEASK